ncbi:NUDIX hydrolase [Candidatus Woesebacteria bacterium]|nr:NUDIX hydrolase [Candidatus Woesebacteria bacterium]
MSNLNDTKKGEILMTLYDKDIFPNIPDVTNIIWKDRPTGKVILFNEKNEIALIGNKVNNFFLLPGGGIEENEGILDGVKRECQEETGCQIEILRMLGITEDFRLRDNKHCISYCYSAKVISHGTSTLTESERDIGAYVKWLSLPEARALFATQEEAVKKGEVKFYNTCFNILRDSLFIRLAQDEIRNI